MRVDGILETCLYVDDLDVAQNFYSKVLGLEVVGHQEGRHVFFRCGPRMLLVFDPRATSRPDSDVPQHGAIGPSHVAFMADSRELDDWIEHLISHGIDIEKIVDWPQGGRSVYFRDPAGNSLEVAAPEIWDRLGIGQR